MVYDLRFEMFRAIYNHKRAQALDLMYRDVLVNADPKYNFLENLHNPETYRNYTDLIVKRIEKSDDPLLSKSKDIIGRIQSRDLYQYVDGFFLERWEWKRYFNEQDIANHSDGALKAQDIILLPTKYDYGCGEGYPIDHMSFYRNDTNFEIIEKVNDTEYGLSKPQRNQEPYVRIFVRDASKFQPAMDAFRKFCRQFMRKRD